MMGSLLQASSSSDSEGEDILPMKRTARQRGKRIQEEEEEDEAPAKSAGRQAKKAKLAGERDRVQSLPLKAHTP